MTTPLDDICARHIDQAREAMTPADRGLFDLTVAFELKKRGLNDADFNQLLRIRADDYRRAQPLIWSLLRSLADAMSAPNVVSLPRPGAKQ